MAVNKVILGSETLLDLTADTATAADVAAGATLHLSNGERATGTATYAGAPENNGNANRSNAILYGAVDSTSTATAYTATIEGLAELVDGTTVMLHNGVVTSASGFTVDINGLGAKKCYNNLTNATQDTTIFNIAYTMMFVYAEDLDEGNGGWWIYRGYDANTNTIGYQLRTNSGRRPASDTGYRYRIWLTSPDGQKWVPINTSSATNATSSRTLNTRAIDPFGPIAYNSTNGTCDSGSNLPAATMWRVYTLTIGYSYVKTLTAWDSVYLKCLPNTDGSAVMKDVVQALPTSKDGFIYILLGTAYSATGMELQAEHPVYWHDGTGIRLWTGAEPSGGSVTVDSALSSTSENPVQNKAINTALQAKQDELVSGTNIKTVNGNSLLGSGDLAISGGGSGSGGVTVRGARVTVPKRTSTGVNSGVAVNGLDGVGAHDIVLFFGTGGYVVCPIGFNGIDYNVHVSGSKTNAFDAFAAIISPNYEVGSQASIVGNGASFCDTTTPLVGDTVTITSTSGANFTVFDAASGGVYADPGTLEAGETYSFTVECATSYISATASGGGNN